MGNGSSKLEKSLSQLPEGERFFGLENFGNTCYANSVLQSLYFCKPFRDRVLAYAANMPATAEENLLTCLAELFQQIYTQKKRAGVIPPRRFVQRLKRDNELFRSYMHQDAHEFLNYLLNECSELLEKEAREKDPKGQVNKFLNGMRSAEPQPADSTSTWITDIFQGKLVNETKCLCCETVTSREEAFYDLSLEIEQNSSLTACLRNFSSTETLDAEDKFFCDSCLCLQEAQKRMKIKQLPQVLCLHLKRFKYHGQVDRLRKLMYRVVFPFDLKLRNTTDDCEDSDQAYSLFAVVVHVGSGPNHGHYICFIKSHGQWVTFDDEQLDITTELGVHKAFGAPSELNPNPEHGYILMYNKETPQPQPPPALSSQPSLQSKRLHSVQ